jgi:hypothetical protein
MLPHGNMLDDEAWSKRHRFLQRVLAVHLPALMLFGLLRGWPISEITHFVGPPLILLLASLSVRKRRLASFGVTAGLAFCSVALVAFSGGTIEAHFHFFIIIGFIALYQDWIPFLWNIALTVLSHGLGSSVRSDLMFNHHAAQASPWQWSALHGLAVLAACVGVVIFWKYSEREQLRSAALARNLNEGEAERLTSNLLVNLARRNQSLLYRQLDLINRLEEDAHDPDELSELFQLDHLATRIRRNGESLLVLAGEEPARIWTEPVLLVDVVRAAIAEIEDMNRVEFDVDERLAVAGRAVADLTHLLAELIENAASFSPPHIPVSVRTRPYLLAERGWVVTIEDWGVGMQPDELAEANVLLASASKVDLSSMPRLGLHVVARLAQRYDIAVTLSPTAGSGVTAAVVLPPTLFATTGQRAQAARHRIEAIPRAPGPSDQRRGNDRPHRPADPEPVPFPAPQPTPWPEPRPAAWAEADQWEPTEAGWAAQAPVARANGWPGRRAETAGTEALGDQPPVQKAEPQDRPAALTRDPWADEAPADPAPEADPEPKRPVAERTERPWWQRAGWGRPADDPDPGMTNPNMVFTDPGFGMTPLDGDLVAGSWVRQPTPVEEPAARADTGHRPPERPAAERLRALSAMSEAPDEQTPRRRADATQPGSSSWAWVDMVEEAGASPQGRDERLDAWVAEETPIAEPPSGPPLTGEPLPRPRPAGPERGTVDDMERRVPQAHLAPQLRRGMDATRTTPGPAPSLQDAERARSALSRYQASRRAAAVALEEHGAELELTEHEPEDRR